MIPALVGVALWLMFVLGFQFACTRYKRQIARDEWRRL